MYTLKKQGGIWRALTRDGIPAFSSLSRRTVSEWIAANTNTR